jgi:hypothetical protein
VQSSAFSADKSWPVSCVIRFSQGGRSAGYDAPVTGRNTIPNPIVPNPIVGVGAVVLALVMGLGWLLWPPARGEIQVARATVVQAVQCGPSNAQDSVRIELLDGRVVPARLDGCGHRPGEVLTVEVSGSPPSGDVLSGEVPSENVVAHLPGTGVPAATADAQRIGAVGVAVAGIAGALLAWRLRGHRS